MKVNYKYVIKITNNSPKITWSAALISWVFAHYTCLTQNFKMFPSLWTFVFSDPKCYFHVNRKPKHTEEFVFPQNSLICVGAGSQCIRYQILVYEIHFHLFKFFDPGLLSTCKLSLQVMWLTKSTKHLPLECILPPGTNALSILRNKGVRNRCVQNRQTLSRGEKTLPCPQEGTIHRP